MRRFLLLAPLLLAGCGQAGAPTEKYFRGQPVEYWLEAIKAPDPRTRQRAADVLGNVGPIDGRAVPALVSAVKDADPKVRGAAVLALSRIGPPAASAEAALQQAARDPDPSVRAHAVKAIEQIRGAGP
jgi:HEAT repeat protein